MQIKTYPLCALALTASLASCAPTIQGPSGEPYVPKTQVGMGMLFVERVQVAALNDQTPDSAYVEFPDCFNAVIQVADVRKLGVEKADEACRETTRQTVRGFAVVVALGAAASLAVVYAFIRIVQAAFGNGW